VRAGFEPVLYFFEVSRFPIQGVSVSVFLPFSRFSAGSSTYIHMLLPLFRTIENICKDPRTKLQQKLGAIVAGYTSGSRVSGSGLFAYAATRRLGKMDYQVDRTTAKPTLLTSLDGRLGRIEGEPSKKS
jgi:hypothetical protein